MLNLAYLLYVLISSHDTSDRGATGIFLTIECRKDIPRKHEMLSAKTVCITQNPIISPKDFAHVGPVREIASIIFFDLTFTPKGHQTLIKLTANLPESQLALVVNDEVFFVFRASELKVAPTFRFQTAIKFRGQVESVHKQLVEIKNSMADDL